jgi:hypothetical protein
VSHSPYLAVELQNYAEWTLSRNYVPHALAQKGITLHDWTNVFDKANALWERHIMEEIEVGRVIMRTLKAYSRLMIGFYMLTFVLSFAAITLGVVIRTTWLVGLGHVSMAVVPIIVCLFLPKLTGSSDIRGVNKAIMEQDWSLLAEEQRHKFNKFGVDVHPIRHDLSSKLGKLLSQMLGIVTIIDGLRFSLDQPNEEQLAFARHKEMDYLPLLSSGPMISSAAIHDLDRLLKLNQTGDEEYQQLKSRILAKTSQAFQSISLPKVSHL